jgi:hypothetical protein
LTDPAKLDGRTLAVVLFSPDGQATVASGCIRRIEEHLVFEPAGECAPLVLPVEAVAGIRPALTKTATMVDGAEFVLTLAIRDAWRSDPT